MISKKELRKEIQRLRARSKQAYQEGNIKLYLQYAHNADFLSQELQEHKGF